MGDDPLVHDYDAAKRRAYYLKTRKLKGRTLSSAKATKVRPTAKPQPPKKTRAQRQAERRRKQEAQVAALKVRLEKLQDAMAELVKAAKARSGVKTPAKKSASSPEKKTNGATKKLTTSQKNEAAKKAEEYRKKNPDEALAADIKSLNEKIKRIQERIAKMRQNGSVGARTMNSKK